MGLGLVALLGFAKTKRNRKAYRKFLEGREDFIIAQRKNPNDSDLYAAIAGSYKDINDDLALYYYRKAYNTNKKNPYPFGNLLILELMKKHKFMFSKKRIKEITTLIEVRESQIEKFEDIPWAFFDLGMFFLFLGKLEKSIDYYLLAIRFSPNEWMIKTTLNTLDKIEHLHDENPSIHTIRKLLLFGMALNLKRNDKSFKNILKELEEKYHFKNNAIPFGERVLILSGDRYSIEDHLFPSYSLVQ